MARNFKELQAKMSPAARAKSEALARHDLEQLTADELLPGTRKLKKGAVALNIDPESEKQLRQGAGPIKPC